MSKRRPRFDSKLSRARNAVFYLVTRPFKSFSRRTRFLIGFAFLVIVNTLLLVTSQTSPPIEEYKEGDVIKRTIAAPADITGIDITETEKLRARAREATRAVFNFDPSRAENAIQSFRVSWSDLKKQTETRGPNTKPPGWSGEGGDAVARAIIAHQFDENDLDRLTRILRETGDGYIYEDS